MFTGIITAIGTVISVERKGTGVFGLARHGLVIKLLLVHLSVALGCA